MSDFYDDDFDEFVLGGGAPAFSFDGQPPISVTGVLKDRFTQQMRDFDDPSVLLEWPDGKPKKQPVLILQTDLRNGDGCSEDTKKRVGEFDEGERAVYLTFRGKKALARALRGAGLRTLTKGTEVTVTYTRNGEKTGKGKPPKEYEIKLVPADDLDIADSIKHEEPPKREEKVEAPQSGGQISVDMDSLSPELRAALEAAKGK